VGKSFANRGEKFPKPVGDDDDDAFDYKEYLRQEQEQELKDRKIEESIAIIPEKEENQ